MKLIDKILLIPATLICLWPIGAVWGKAGAKIPFHLKQNPEASPMNPTLLSETVETLLFEASNQERAKNKGVPFQAFQSEAILVRAARDHSRDMLRRNYLSHFSPEKKSVVDRVKKYQPQLRRSLGENLHTITSAQGLTDPPAIVTQMMEDWMHSPSHRKNILSKDYKFLGVGCASTKQTIFCTQVFGGPQN
ncbi:MAG TPA: hypothetical protein DF383_12975 [Deltaproteobacteria bacterium]|nr:hypothetical protein [Deltaproteobacteria bacterium]